MEIRKVPHTVAFPQLRLSIPTRKIWDVLFRSPTEGICRCGFKGFLYLLVERTVDLSPFVLKRVAANNHRRTSTTSSRKPSLALCDTPDGFRDLGHLELMSRELDPTGAAQLNRSISTDSLSSISSIANNFGHDFTVGQLEVTLEFEPFRHRGQGAGLLHVTLHQGKDLLEKEEGDFPGCFIRVSLGPEEINVGVTRVRTELSRSLVLTRT